MISCVLFFLILIMWAYSYSLQKLLAFNLSVFKYTTKILYAFRLLPQQPTYLVVGLQLVHSVLCFFFMFYVLYVVSFNSFLFFPGSN
jgi:hypothetical protein